MENRHKVIPLLDTAGQYHLLESEIHKELTEVLLSGQYIMGPKVEDFEKAMAEYCEVKYAIGVANGTDALQLTLDAMGISSGDEVITTPFTFFATAEVISKLNAIPVFVDIDPVTYNIDVSKIEAAITSKTKAIIPVHLFGQPANMDEILEIANRRNLFVIEDACQAIGSSYKGKKVGCLGNAGCFSFFPTKNLGGFGDGGMIVTNDLDLANKLKVLRIHGSSQKYYHSHIGYNSRLDPLQAAALHVKLPHLDTFNQLRRKKAAEYNHSFNSLPLTLPTEQNHHYSVYHLYIIQTPSRDQLREYLQKHGIQTGVYYPKPLHLQEVYKHLGYNIGDFPEAEKASLSTLALPLYPELTEEDQSYVISTVKDFFSNKRG
ncbi:dTDP-4-amino-4,6-dideoxygalactose transaminase [Bacillus mesophilus]|uniref:DegT/DnrJ/EryC1/StrS family aminotransferase n=1 Tax=Bacillus mesophilus TaxID=1808955 RepID=A0A6M0QB21_9BACI|nr:DegT/DnrJ/EryC1/StrS family aminotransferase [Bacillus mesophilus]MBM7662857.1 dTDP-4-amino-4,6-dideoxygalactose transaminase [Bacillus mesophilus]NEY73447.1 DegT/DnrJ/EryC1/StrS family aminotransferase [Bacillus mesophilus]